MCGKVGSWVWISFVWEIILCLPSGKQKVGECCVERKLSLVARHKIFEAERTRKRNARLQEIAEAVVACRCSLGYSFLLLEFKFNCRFVVRDFAPGEADEFLVSRIDGGIQSGRNGNDCMTGGKA